MKLIITLRLIKIQSIALMSEHQNIDIMENQQLEWKEIWHDEHLKWICGFANAQGDTLVIGKNDKGETVGVKNAKKLLEDFLVLQNLQFGRIE